MPARLSRIATTMTAFALLAIAAPAAAHAAYGDDFGVAGAQGALPGPSAFWAGTCDLTSPAADVGTAPASARDCIDLGVTDTSSTQADPWATPPTWRLAPVTQAGGHPDATTVLTYNRDTSAVFGAIALPSGSTKDIRVDLPVGLTGNPGAVGTCSPEQFAVTPPECPPQSQVGVAESRVNIQNFVVSRIIEPVYNLVPRVGRTAEFGIPGVGPTPIRIEASARTDGDFGLTTTVKNIPTALPLLVQSLTFWGVPWAASHDRYRNKVGPMNMDPAGVPPADQAPYDPSWGPIQPFMSNPTSCDGASAAPVTRLITDSWQHPGETLADGTADLSDPNWKQYDSPAPAVTGCADVPFAGSLDVAPVSPQAGAPSGYAFDLRTPQNTDPGELGNGHLKRATVTLPEGLRVNPSSADGLSGCTLEQARLKSKGDATCPDASKIGSLSIDTPLLEEPMRGDIYLAQPHDNAFDALLSLVLVARGPGIVVKLPGRIDPDPVTGRLTAVFDNQPQLPFSTLHLAFTDGPRAPLSNPPTCGTKTTHTELTSWSGKTVESNSSFEITGCPAPGARPFAPRFDAGTTDPLAGVFSPFTMNVSRTDLDQELDAISLHMPSGLLGMISSVPLCPEAQLADGSCGAQSRVGSTTVGAGAGTTPLYLKGDVYVGGPYKGAPFSLSIVVDTKGQAGPFDLGKVVVRAPINVDAEHAKLDVPADPLPRILQGIPLQIRSVNVTLDRPGFTFNATSCDASEVGASLTGTEGASTYRSARYQPTDCGRLPFKPTMTAKSRGRVFFKNGADLHVHIGQQPGEAAIKSVAVRLPKQLPSRLIPTINDACTMAVFKTGFLHCPADSYIGTSTARTPLFDEPLSGPVYIVARPNDVPQIVVVLFGRGIAKGITLQLYGDIIINSGGGRTLSTFHMVPDVPITSFDLDLPAGPHSILDAPSDDLCRGPVTMDVTEIAQSGRRQDHQVKIAVSDCPTIGKVKHVRTRYENGLLRVSIVAPAAGRAFLSGPGIWPTSRPVVKKGRYILQARVTGAARVQLQRRAVKLAARVRFQPGNAPRASAVTGRVTVPREVRRG